MTTHIDHRPLKVLVAAAVNAKAALGLRYRPVVVRSEASAFGVAAQTRWAVMLGEGAYWVACPADAARLERAGYEWAPKA